MYNAWGEHSTYFLNQTVITDVDSIKDTAASNINSPYKTYYELAKANPFRYRGYYYDTETKLYYLQTRYYDPEVGRFISQDSIEYADPQAINGLNLYAYCGNNPVMNVDPTGNAWWNWLAGALAAVGTILFAGAVAALTAGVGVTLLAGTLTGAVIHGAAAGALVGAGIGITAGAIIGGAVSDWTAEGILVGMGIGFGTGAIIGAVIGGFVGANGWYNARALELTNAGATNEVVLGRSSDGYFKIARDRNATYFHASQPRWTELESQVGRRGMEKINRIFLKNQIAAGKTFTLISNPTGLSRGYLFKELTYLSSKGIGYLVAFL